MSTAPWTPRRPFLLMVLVTVIIALVSPFDMTFGSPGQPGHPSVIPLLLGAGLVILQLRFSIATARAERPRGGVWALLALAALVYPPIHWYGANWWPTLCLLMASAPMALRRRWLIITVAAIPELNMIGLNVYSYVRYDWPVSGLVEGIAFWGITLPMEAALLYGAARMVRAADELVAARTELAELAIAQERLRISRDLHDLIGQSLSAVSLRGDLALRLLEHDPRAAQSEIATLTATARGALHDVLGITSDSRGTDLRTEADGARALLAAAGIDTTIELDAADLAPDTRVVFAWALREGVTNVLRHSEAASCSIAVTHGPGRAARLEIVNDGVRETAATTEGNGLTGLAERARAFSGAVTAGPLPGGQFRLTVEFAGETP